MLGNGLAIPVLEEIGRWLGVGLAGFVNVFNQEVVGVVGVMEAGELILEAARRGVKLRARRPRQATWCGSRRRH